MKNATSIIPLAHGVALHQADNLAKLRQELLSVPELIAQILCAVGIARTNAVFVNRQKRSHYYLGDSHGRCVPSE